MATGTGGERYRWGQVLVARGTGGEVLAVRGTDGDGYWWGEALVGRGTGEGGTGWEMY